MESDSQGYVRMTDHTNLYNKALTIIKRMGFEIFLYPTPIQENFTGFGRFYAKKGNKSFDAEDPLRLLGIIRIWEEHGDDWNQKPKFKTEKIRSELMDEAYPDSPADYEEFGEEKYNRFVKKCQSFFSLGMFPDVEIKDDISKEDLFELISSLENNDTHNSK